MVLKKQDPSCDRQPQVANKNLFYSPLAGTASM